MVMAWWAWYREWWWRLVPSFHDITSSFLIPFPLLYSFSLSLSLACKFSKLRKWKINKSLNKPLSHSLSLFSLWLCDENGSSSRVSTVVATSRQRRRRAPPPGSRGPSPRSHRGAPAPPAKGRSRRPLISLPQPATALPALLWPCRLRTVVRCQRHRQPLPNLPPLLWRPRRHRHPPPRFQARSPPVLLFPHRSQGHFRNYSHFFVLFCCELNWIGLVWFLCDRAWISLELGFFISKIEAATILNYLNNYNPSIAVYLRTMCELAFVFWLQQLVSEKDLIVREEACRIGLFFGGFTGSYQALRCLLRKLRKKETPFNA